MPEPWNVSGTILIACSCDWGCPCNFNARPTKGYCEGGWTWVIESGREGDVSLDGLAFSVFCKWPGAIHEGGGVATSFVDERADSAQRAAVGRLVRGDLGGPWAIFINTYTFEGPAPARYDIRLADYQTTLRIGDSVHLEVAPIANPVTGAEVHPEIVLPEGLVLNRAVLGVSKTFTVETEPITYDYSGQYTAWGRFAYEGTGA